MLTSIILPYYNHWDLVHARLYELHTRVKEPCEIMLINDASDEGDCVTGAKFWVNLSTSAQKHHKIFLHNNYDNLGFGGAHNIGAEKSSGDVLVFLSNDVVIRGDFVAEIIQKIVSSDKPALVGGRLLDYNTGWNTFIVNGAEKIFPYLEGWLLACKRSVWNEIGGFDSRYGKFDYEDVDLSTTALSLGYNLIAINSPHLTHLSGRTINNLGVDRVKITEENKEKFRRKWMKI